MLYVMCVVYAKYVCTVCGVGDGDVTCVCDR